MFGKIEYDPLADALLCEFPVIGKDGSRTICGKWCRSLARHITKHHKITTRQYKQLLGLDVTKSLICQEMKIKLRRAIKDRGAEMYLKKGQYLKKGFNKVQKYKRSIQTRKRLLKSLDKAHKVRRQKTVVKSLQI